MVSVLGDMLLKSIFINYWFSRREPLIRLMFFSDPRTPAVPLFLETKQLPISFVLFEELNLLMYYVHNNLAPDSIKNMFTKLSSVHSYRTRSSVFITGKNRKGFNS